ERVYHRFAPQITRKPLPQEAGEPHDVRAAKLQEPYPLRSLLAFLHRAIFSAELSLLHRDDHPPLANSSRPLLLVGRHRPDAAVCCRQRSHADPARAGPPDSPGRAAPLPAPALGGGPRTHAIAHAASDHRPTLRLRRRVALAGSLCGGQGPEREADQAGRRQLARRPLPRLVASDLALSTRS